jgi:hypothetical protein
MRYFLDRFAPKPAEVDAWLHLGAGVAATIGRARAINFAA